MQSTEHQPDSRTLLDYLGIIARGFAMGTSGIVPGVSGGTLALVLGIYEELISSIKALLDPDAIKLALQFKLKDALDLIPWKFLASVATGIFLAVFTMSFFLEWVLQNHPSLLWAFFFGLVAASILTVGRRIKKWGVAPVLGIVIGAVGAYLLVGLVPVATPDTWWLFLLSGAIAICGMILPGVSGSFILVLLGKYERILSAVTNWELFTLIMVIAGALIGVVTIVQLLSWLFKKYHDPTIAVLTGMLLGSLRRIWPWKETIETVLDRHGVPVPIKQINVLPAEWTLQVTIVIVLAILGFLLISGLTMWAARRQPVEE
jgi:putative membrane protein